MADPARYRTYYDAFYSRGDFDHYPARINSALIALLIKRYFSGDARLADLGCGTGVHLRLFEEAGARITGVDISGVALRIARERGAGTLVHGNARELPFRDGSFDGAVSFGCSLLNGLDDRLFDVFLSEALRIVRPGGWCVFCTSSDFSGAVRSGWRQYRLEELAAHAARADPGFELLAGFPRLLPLIGPLAVSPAITRAIRASGLRRNAMVALALKRRRPCNPS